MLAARTFIENKKNLRQHIDCLSIILTKDIPSSIESVWHSNLRVSEIKLVFQLLEHQILKIAYLFEQIQAT